MPSLQLDLLAKDNASMAIKGMTQSIFSANIAMELLKKGAEFAAEAIGNAVKSNAEYKKITDETTKNVNALAIGLGSSLVTSLRGSVEAIRDFTGEAKNIETIGGSFALLIEFGRRLIKDVFEALKVAITPVTDLFKSFSEKGETSAGAMKALAVVMEVLKTTLAIVGSILKLVIQTIIDLISVVFEAGKTIASFFEMLAGKKKWDDVKKQFDETGKAVNVLAKNVVDNGKNIIEETVKQLESFNARTKKSTEDNIKIYKDGGDAALKATIEAREKIQAAQDEASRKEAEAAAKALADKLAKEKAALDKAAADKQAAQQAQAEKEKTIAFAYAGAMVDIQKQMISLIQQSFDNYYAEQLDTLSNWKDSHLDQIDDWVSEEEERQGVKQASDSERLQGEIQELQNTLNIKQTAEEKTAIQMQIKEKQDEMKRLQIREEAEKKKEALEKDAAKKELALKKQQFEANKAFSIVNIWLNAASSVMGWWAAFASMGIPGVVLAAVMTAATLTMAGVQTGLVAGQTFHGQEGGLISKGQTTGDNAVLFANKGEALFQDTTYKNLVNQINGGGMGSETNNFNIGTLILQGVNDPVQLATQLKDLQRYEKAR